MECLQRILAPVLFTFVVYCVYSTTYEVNDVPSMTRRIQSYAVKNIKFKWMSISSSVWGSNFSNEWFVF